MPWPPPASAYLCGTALFTLAILGAAFLGLSSSTD